ncbi:hypothetical protein R6242_19290 [Iodobacter sp. CM08]|uniref:hypothetical protein n=1 Tax=Iodobacter sp. CM08 TaxID=3085902 RepID=UPI0029829CED|nr:hypothetical protein [Iodobacter sp. CM08]MDW5418716.1 hypothetical protein [Iodobacter sp. CM08]
MLGIPLAEYLVLIINLEKSKTEKIMQNKISGVIIFIIGITGSIMLKIYGIISEPSFLTFTVLTVLIALFIAYSNKVQSISLLKGELILKDIKETEASIKELAKAILEVTETFQHGIMLESFDCEPQEKAVEKLRKLTI